MIRLSENNSIIVSRASSGIYLILKTIGVGRRKVIVPGNICYAAIYPVVYAGMEPVFCDVDGYSGNVTVENVENVLSDDVCAAIIPHMYGNPVAGFPDIEKICEERNIIIIEDCASAMGISPDDYESGKIGRYTVYSTGYSKTLDLGIGGIVYGSEMDIERLKEAEQELPLYSDKNAEQLAFFSKLYRLMRNESAGIPGSRDIYLIMQNSFKECFISRLDDGEKKRIRSGLYNLDNVIHMRSAAFNLYEGLLSFEGSVFTHYRFGKGAVPWRYNILVDPGHRREVIDNCLAQDIPVSDWYPSVLPMFMVDESLPGVEFHEKSILNFPILTTEEQINRICRALNEMQK